MHKNYIGGAWVEGATEIRNINPSDTSDVVGVYSSASLDEVKTAINAASAAFGQWATSNVLRRAEALEFIAAEILARKDELGQLLSREEGKTLPEGIAEVVRAGQIFRFFAGETLRQRGELLSSLRPDTTVEITREPIGVVGIITPWNFPIAIPAWKIAPALAFGNCVVFKPAELVPGSAWALSEIISRSGIPAGVFNLVMGRGSVVGQAILESKSVNAITFTGSVSTGERVMKVAGSRFAKLQLEMGGKNPLIVAKDADLDVAINCAVAGGFFSTGQRCTASSRFIVDKTVYEQFVAGMVTRLNSLVVDHALKPGTDIGPVASSDQIEQDLDYVRVGKGEGARLVCGGELLKRDTNGYYMSPALFADATSSMRLAREEIFGPVACIIPADNYEHALSLANDTEFGLTAGICTTSLKQATHFKRHAQAGMVMVNTPTAGVDFHVPFGGRKGSSYGSREQGSYAIEFFTTIKTSYTAT